MQKCIFGIVQNANYDHQPPSEFLCECHDAHSPDALSTGNNDDVKGIFAHIHCFIYLKCDTIMKWQSTCSTNIVDRIFSPKECSLVTASHTSGTGTDVTLVSEDTDDHDGPDQPDHPHHPALNAI